MNDIKKLLGLKPEADENAIGEAILALQDQNESLTKENASVARENEKLKAKTPAKLGAREALIAEKMTAGLSREIAEESVSNQEAEDAIKAKAEKTSEKK